MNTNYISNNSGFINESSNNVILNDKNSNTSRNNFFEYITESITNKLINYFNIPEFNTRSNNLSNDTVFQRKNTLVNNNQKNSFSIKNDIYQIKKNKKILDNKLEYNITNIKKNLNDTIIQKIKKKRKENIDKFLMEYRLKNSKKAIDPFSSHNVDNI